MQKLIDELYDEFKGLPSSGAIVRNGQKGDAFALCVLKILYGTRLNLQFTKNNIDELAQFIPAPPDSGIDIFVEEDNGDDSHFDIIQVKNSNLSELDIKQCFSYMKETIRDYCNKPTKVKSLSCREILSNSSLDKNNKKNCSYFVVHSGDIHGSITDNDDEIVLNINDLKIIQQSKKDKVVKETISVPSENSILMFDSDNSKQSAIVCSMNCLDLAKLEDKYYSTEIGRNILFGHNLREALKKSKTYDGMLQTIKTEPQNFWYYNNGITIVADKVDKDVAEDDSEVTITIKEFSIVNGAQTTSAVGRIYREAIRDRKDDIIEGLSKAYVVTRILKVANEKTKRKISVYNNTQNQINSRDMVANNPEQEKLHDRLLSDDYPQIFMEIRRGENLPHTFNKLYSHRITTNEELAQMAYAGFLLQPFTAKDKKAALFNPDYSQTDYTLNEIYHKVFNFVADDSDKNGVLQNKRKTDIDELLFSQQLYKESKTALKKIYQARIDSFENKKLSASEEEKTELDRKIKTYSRRLDTIGVCMVYFVATYYEFAMEYGEAYKDKRYEYDKYYSDKNYRKTFVSAAAEFFLSKTVDILIDTADAANKGANINNWVRSLACDTAYKNKISSVLASDLSLETRYKEFMDTYKVVPV